MLDSFFVADADGVVLAQSAARWLSRIRFQVRAHTPVFGPGLSSYNDMADPKAPSEKRLAACRNLLTAVQRHVVVEQVIAADQTEYAPDPYAIEFRTTQRGAVLEMIASTLEAAVAALELKERR